MVRALVVALLLGSPALADDDPGGTLNPPELGRDAVLGRLSTGKVGMTDCAHAYATIKQGDFANGRRIVEVCADAGWTGVMAWGSYVEENGLGGPEDPEAAAAWDRRAADAGDPVGLYNYGLGLLRGYGVERDVALGQSYIDRAADAGLESAIRLKAAGYNPDVLTPDADEWRHPKIGEYF